MGAKNCLPGRQAPATTPAGQLQWAPGYQLQWISGSTFVAGPQSVSSTTAFTSETFNMSNLDDIGLQVVFGGTPTGTLLVQVSIDNVTWDSIPTADINGSITSPSGSAINNVYSIKHTPFPYLRIKYTNASSTGTINVFVSGKDLN